MQYDLYGPLWLPRFDGVIERGDISEFWREVDDELPGLSQAVGIYVFSTCHGENFTPWYVGMTNCKSGFRGEVFQGHKINHYVASAELKRGYPAVHLIPPLSPGGNLARSSAKAGRNIEVLETAMISLALQANPDLRNTSKTKFLRRVNVPGIMGKKLKGPPAEPIRTLRNSLNL